MDLHLVLDSHVRPLSNPEDTVLVTPYNSGIVCNGELLIMDKNIINLDAAIPAEINELLSSSLKDYDKISNRVYDKLFKPLYACIKNVEIIIASRAVKTIVLYGGSKSPYFTSEGAEGEGLRGDYETNWMVNAFIYEKYKSKYEIKWYKQRSVIYFKFKNFISFVRNTIRLLGVRVIKSIKKTHPKALINNRVDIISIVGLALQINHLRTIVDGIQLHKNRRWAILSYNDSLEGEDIYYIPELSLAELTSIIKDTLFWPWNYPKTKIMGVESRALGRELVYSLLNYNIYTQRAINFLKSIDCHHGIMLSDTTLGMDMVSIHNIAELFRLKHFNFQYVSMERMIYPNMELADEYYVYSLKTYGLYKTISPSYKFYFPVQNNHSVEVKTKCPKIIFTIFTQPDSFTSDYLEYLDTILPVIAKKQINIVVVIKPHYRQNMLDRFKQYEKEYSFVRLANKDESCSFLLESTSLSMSISSSVIFESVLNRVPCIVYNPKHKYDYDIYEEDYCLPELNFVTDEALQTIDLLESIDSITEVFENRFECYIKEMGATTDPSKVLEMSFNEQ